MELMKINKLGEEVWRKHLYCVPTTVTYILLTGGYAHQIVQASDGHYVMVLHRKNPLNEYDVDISFVKFDEEGNVLWINIWEDELDMPSAFGGINVTSDGGFIGAGYYNYPSVPSRGYVVKMDSLCNIEWEWSETLERGVFYSVFETEEGDFVAGGYGEGEVYTNSDLYVVKLSSEGTLLHDFVYLNTFPDAPGMVFPYTTEEYPNNDTYLLLGGVWDENDLANPRKQYIALLDSTLSPIWEKKHPSPLDIGMGFGASVVIKEDGSFVGFREYFDGEKDEIVLMWYNNEGELTHTTHYNPTPEIYDHVAGDFKATSDGGYIIIGHDHLPVPKRTFVMKLDENGDVCNPADCIDYLEYEVIEDSTMTPDDTITSIFTIELSNLVSVYPNPVTNQITFNFYPTANPPILSLYNNLGQIVKKEEIVPSKKILLNDLPTGIYYWELYKQNGKIIIRGE